MILHFQVESQLSSINTSLEAALGRRLDRRSESRTPRRRASSQPAPRNRVSREHVQIIPISFEDNDQDVKRVERRHCNNPGLSSVSRVLISSSGNPGENQSSAEIKTTTKPNLPDKPKNIQLIKKKLENLKSANICSNSDLAQRTALLRNSNKLKNNPVIFLILAMQIR